MMDKRQQKKTRIVGLRMSAEEFAEIEGGWKKSTLKKLSEYLRNLIFGKPVATVYRNQSMDDLVAELALLRQELNRIGVNFNQSVRKLHTLHDTADFRRWMMAHELDKRTMSNKLDEIRSHILKIVESWLR